ncbi:glycosyl hydrolase family 18 protein, partial [bacterium]|nr:glycosyl hydrolase family 18 protein [bacterium]
MDYCDFISFFGYDFGGNWYDQTCHNAPLFGGDNINDSLHNPTGRNQVLSELIDVYLTDVGIPANKLIMGIPFYGKLFEGVTSTGVVENMPGLYESAPRNHNSGCSAPQPVGTWDAASCENSGSIEFCDLSQGIATNPHHYLDSNNPLVVSAQAAANGWVRYWDDIAKVPYLYNETLNKFISYDDGESINIKVQHALSLNLGSVMIWELSQNARDSDNSLLIDIDNSLVSTPELQDVTLIMEDPNQNGLENIIVKLLDSNGTVLAVQLTDASGSITFNELSSSSAYTLDYGNFNSETFYPMSVSFDAYELENDATINIIASNELSEIQGTVTENGQLLTNVEVVLKDANQKVFDRIISTDGIFVFNSVINDLDYILTIEKEYYTSDSISIMGLNSNQANQEIVANRNTHTISGTLVSSDNEFQNGRVNLIGNGQTYSSSVNSAGNYTFENIPAGYNYQLTPNLSGVVFNPEGINITMLNNPVSQDFIENTGLIFGTIKNGQTPVSGALIALTLPWTDSNHPYQLITKTADSDGNYFYTETELEGYASIVSLKLESWQNNNIVFFPTNLANVNLTSNPQEFNFNSQAVNPEIVLTSPNAFIQNIALGAEIELEALVSLSYNDGATTISNVEFDIDGTVIAKSNNQESYTGNWMPEDSDFGMIHTFTVTAESSNNVTLEESFEFSINCVGTNCPNLEPTIVLNNVNLTINQNTGFEPIPIDVTVDDEDGSINSVTISINGGISTMTGGTNNTYIYNFTPTSYQAYEFTVTATDNEGGTSNFNESFNIISSEFVPLPSEHIILGYTHSWENSGAPFLYFNEMHNKNYNVVMYSFIETVGQNGYSPQLTINSNRYQTNGVFDSQLLKDDINSLRDQGIPVIVSIGGQNGHVELNTVAEKDEFVQGLNDIVD